MRCMQAKHRCALTLLILVPARLARALFSCSRFLVYSSFGVLGVEHFFRFSSGSVHSQEMVWYNLTGEPLPHHFTFTNLAYVL